MAEDFKLHHGINQLSIQGENLSANTDCIWQFQAAASKHH